ncbi:hypothetical protein BJ944DRAFT_238888 [Cunninghamella echinulata]|nr:hypothetical protein BJ944DRAFT_238888 [Cunninghamella echinulata]
MYKLSDELTENIFLFLSQRYLHRISLVCKKWLQITRQPKFYKSVELCSTSQIEKFIEFIQMVTINDIPLNLYIKEIIFYDQFIHNLNPHRLVALINLCPFVNQINNIPDIGENGYKVLSDTNYWRHLKSLPLSYTKIDKRWVNYMINTSSSSNSNYKITSLSIDVSQYTMLSTEEYSNTATDDESNYKLLKIENQRGRSLTEEYDDYNLFGGILPSSNSYCLKLPSSLVSLRELHLDFETYNKNRSLCYYKFNESTLDSISTSCPSLTRLTLSEFNFNISNTFRNQLDPSLSSTTNFSSINISSQLNYLNLYHCFLHDPSCYTYIQYKYPNLTSLNLILKYIPEMNTRYTEYRSTIGDLITSYDDSLTDLRIHYASDYARNVNEHQYWPHTKLLEWLITHPNQLTTFRYPFDLFTIEREDNDWETALAIEKSLTNEQRSQLLPQYRNYLQNLKTLELKFDITPDITLQYLLYQKSRNPMTQSSLYHSVEYLYAYAYFYLDYHDQTKERQFYIYDWLSAFSGLKKLEVRNLWLIQDDQSVDLQQQKFVTCDRTTYFLSPCYRLTELNLSNCRICFSLCDMARLLKSLVNLQSLYINGIWFTAISTSDPFIISVPHLNLYNLQLSNIKYDLFDYWTGIRCRTTPEYKRYYIENIEVKEISTNNSIKAQNTPNDSSLSASDKAFNFVCNSVENFWS